MSTKEFKILIIDSYQDDEIVKNLLQAGWKVELNFHLIEPHHIKLFLSRPILEFIAPTTPIDKTLIKDIEQNFISTPRRLNLNTENLFERSVNEINTKDAAHEGLYGLDLLMSKDLTRHRGSSTGYRGVYYIKNPKTNKGKFRAEIQYKKYNFSKTKLCDTLDEAVKLRLKWEQDLLLLYKNNALKKIESVPRVIRKKPTASRLRESEIIKSIVATDIKYTSNLEGSSCLVRHINSHIISSTRRLGNNTNSINRICISNEIRNLFFRESTRSVRHKENGKPSIDARDAALYDKWSKFMNDIYLKDIAKL